MEPQKNSCASKPIASYLPKNTQKLENPDFFLLQILTPCLSEYSYYIESEGESLVIDPIKDLDIYLDLISSRGSKLKYILETHFHADFVSGHQELSKKTGAKIVFGPKSVCKFDFHQAADHENIPLGSVNIEVLHTPGHTFESSCFLLKDSKNKQISLFTGDTLFINEVGRPDLACNADITPKDLAKNLYESIRDKIAVLPDDVIIYPGHGSGSACGKSIGSGDFTTIGEQKKTNYAMKPDLKLEDFIILATTDLPRPLGYMTYDVSVNKGERELVEKELITKRKMNYSLFKETIEKNPDAYIIDNRDKIPDGIVKNSIYINFNLNFAVFVGTLIKPETKLLLICENDEISEASITRLLRIGYDNILGYLEGGISNWISNGGELSLVNNIEAEEFVKLCQDKDNLPISIDVRNKAEFEAVHLTISQFLPLRDLEQKIKDNQLEEYRNKKIYLNCRSGGRGLMALSILIKSNFHNVWNISGGILKLVEVGADVIKNN